MIKTRSYRRLPKTKEIDEKYFPKWPITYDILGLPENVFTLNALFARLYQRLEQVTVVGPRITKSRLFTLITVSSTNPKTSEPWYDEWRIFEDGSMFCRMVKGTSWGWRLSYRQKSKRILNTWLYNIMYSIESKRLMTIMINVINSRVSNPDAWDIYDLLKDSEYVRYYVSELPVP
jgi:hypothetical protein